LQVGTCKGLDGGFSEGDIDAIHGATRSEQQLQDDDLASNAQVWMSAKATGDAYNLGQALGYAGVYSVAYDLGTRVGAADMEAINAYANNQPTTDADAKKAAALKQYNALQASYHCLAGPVASSGGSGPTQGQGVPAWVQTAIAEEKSGSQPPLTPEETQLGTEVAIAGTTDMAAGAADEGSNSKDNAALANQEASFGNTEVAALYKQDAEGDAKGADTLASAAAASAKGAPAEADATVAVADSEAESADQAADAAA